MGQEKPFERKRIPEFSCKRKHTVDINIFITSQNSNRKIKSCNHNLLKQ